MKLTTLILLGAVQILAMTIFKHHPFAASVLAGVVIGSALWLGADTIAKVRGTP